MGSYYVAQAGFKHDSPASVFQAAGIIVCPTMPDSTPYLPFDVSFIHHQPFKKNHQLAVPFLHFQLNTLTTSIWLAGAYPTKHSIHKVIYDWMLKCQNDIFISLC
jgi:hypothetical protein